MPQARPGHRASQSASGTPPRRPVREGVGRDEPETAGDSDHEHADTDPDGQRRKRGDEDDAAECAEGLNGFRVAAVLPECSSAAR